MLVLNVKSLPSEHEKVNLHTLKSKTDVVKTIDRTPLTLVHNTTSSADSPFKLGADFSAEVLNE